MPGQEDDDDSELMRFLQEIHGSDPEYLRDAHVARAVNTLEASHRRAAAALRNLTVSGTPARDAQAHPQNALPAPTAQKTTAGAGAPTGAAGAAQDGSTADGLGAHGAPEGTGPRADGAVSPTASDASHLGQPDKAAIPVVSGEGKEVALDHRTLTHIVRPNRGRR